MEFHEIAKEIIRNVALVGLDEAGTRIAGSAWPTIKKALSPAVRALEERYPALFLASARGTSEARQAAESAVDDLSRDAELKGLLAEGFESLSQGQRQILERLARQDEDLRAIRAELAVIRKGIDEGNEESGRLKAVSAVETVLQAVERGEISREIAPLLIGSVQIGEFLMEVLNDGRPHETYVREVIGVVTGTGPEARILPGSTEYRVRMSDTYEGPSGEELRDVVATHKKDGEWIEMTTVFQRERGSWKRVGLR
jgi:hypothetical protein